MWRSGPPKAGEVRVRHTAIGVNYIDTYFRSGLYQAPSLPFVPGNEGAGEVVAVGEGATGFSPGDRVAYVGTLGAYAEERNVDAKVLVKTPPAVSDDTAAAMMLKA
jgi:NADPH2:quinone reductase